MKSSEYWRSNKPRGNFRVKKKKKKEERVIKSIILRSDRAV